MSSSARDSTRLYTATNLIKGLDVTYQQKGSYPLPDAPSVTLTLSGTTIGYQGTVGANVLSLANMKGNVLDPLDGQPFTYSVNASLNSEEVMGWLESQSSSAYQAPRITQTAYAANYASRYPFTKGNQLGILVDSTNNPLQNITTSSGYELLANTGTTLTAYLSTTSTLQGTGSALSQL